MLLSSVYALAYEDDNSTAVSIENHDNTGSNDLDTTTPEANEPAEYGENTNHVQWNSDEDQEDVICGDGTLIEDIIGEINDEIINAVIPMNIDFIIDPHGFMQLGQIYSVPHVFENRSDFDIVITFSGISIHFANNTDFLPMGQPFGEELNTGLKAVYMALDFDVPGIEPIVVTSPETSKLVLPVSLKPHGTETVIYGTDIDSDGNEIITIDEIIKHYQTTLNITGNVNVTPDNAWASGDVRISINYNIEKAHEE